MTALGNFCDGVAWLSGLGHQRGDGSLIAQVQGQTKISVILGHMSQV